MLLPHQCQSETCIRKPTQYFEDGQLRPCEHCGEVKNLVRCAIVHLLVEDPKGPINGIHGSKLNIACEDGRKKYPSLSYLTGDRNASSCYYCREATPEPVSEKSGPPTALPAPEEEPEVEP